MPETDVDLINDFTAQETETEDETTEEDKTEETEDETTEETTETDDKTEDDKEGDEDEDEDDDYFTEPETPAAVETPKPPAEVVEGSEDKYVLDRLAKILDGLQVYPERMKKNLESSNGLVFSQTVLLRLIDAGLGRLEAYDLVQRNAMKTWKGEGSLRQTLGADPEVTKRLSARELDACFSLEPYAASAREILKRGGCL